MGQKKFVVMMKRFCCVLFILLTVCACSRGNQSGNSSSTEQADPSGQMTSWGPYKSEGLDRNGLHNESVLLAMSRVPRHEFVPQDVSYLAYEDRALPIGSKQTISQPYIVALMTQEAEIVPGARVLEIGTGSGYQAAVLAELGAEVYSIEIIPELAQAASEKLETLGYSKVHVQQGDGWQGWPEEAPFDAILVTAAAPRPPEKLIEQLANHGRMIVPLESKEAGGEQLLLIERRDTSLVTRNLGPVRFVPLTGDIRADRKDKALEVAETLTGQNPKARARFSSVKPEKE